MNKIKSQVCALIPARSESKGISNKNIRNIVGMPLIAYSIKAALKSKLIDRVIVSTDSQYYKKMAEDFGAEVPFIRPAEISQDASTDIECFNHLIKWFSTNERYVPSYFVHLRPTTPLRDPDIIDSAIEELINSDFTSLRSVNKMSRTAYKSFEIKNNILVSAFKHNNNIDLSNLGRQNYPETYEGNGYVDVIRSNLIIESNKLHGDKSLAFLTDAAHEIDELSDIPFIEFEAKNNPHILEKLFN
ncbi:acylneuraminate cytidylyltransferase family protein [Candidatus Thioglobus sp.]|nr:acylneuraminate cytidylyltransferase family protein [Candidatus Thioglobus sp.]